MSRTVTLPEPVRDQLAESFRNREPILRESIGISPLATGIPKNRRWDA
jgi:hypothetical protein